MLLFISVLFFFFLLFRLVSDTFINKIFTIQQGLFLIIQGLEELGYILYSNGNNANHQVISESDNIIFKENNNSADSSGLCKDSIGLSNINLNNIYSDTSSRVIDLYRFVEVIKGFIVPDLLNKIVPSLNVLGLNDLNSYNVCLSGKLFNLSLGGSGLLGYNVCFNNTKGFYHPLKPKCLLGGSGHRRLFSRTSINLSEDAKITMSTQAVNDKTEYQGTHIQSFLP